MRRLAWWIVAGLLVAAWPAPAPAASGTGLYEPFPAHTSKTRAKRFLRQLPVKVPALAAGVTNRELERGVFVEKVPPPVHGAASRRARGGGRGSSLGWPTEAALILAALGVAPAVASRRT